MSNNNERPGVYTSYSTSGVLYSGTAAYAAGVAAAGVSGTHGEIYTITSATSAEAIFGAASSVANMCRLLFKNGASVIKAVRAENDYEAAFSKLCAEESVKVIVCDSTDGAVHSALKTAIESAEGRNAHKIGVVEGEGTVQELIAAAAAINSERVVMAAPGAVDAGGAAVGTGSVAAAIAGVILSQTDPAIPLNGAVLKGIDGVGAKYSDGDITLLVRGGITPVESIGGKVEVVRGITTRTLTGGVADSSWRELSSVLIVDDVIPSVRDALKNGFMRAKNTVQTRGAIRTRVIIELESKLAAEIIDGYDNVTVTQNTSDPTVCDVAFEFTVAHGLNRIVVSAYITV